MKDGVLAFGDRSTGLGTVSTFKFLVNHQAPGSTISLHNMSSMKKWGSTFNKWACYDQYCTALSGSSDMLSLRWLRCFPVPYFFSLGWVQVTSATHTHNQLYFQNLLWPVRCRSLDIPGENTRMVRSKLHTWAEMSSIKTCAEYLQTLW